MNIKWLLQSNVSKYDLLSEDNIYIPDDIEYEVIINVDVEFTETVKKPDLYLGDVKIELTVLNTNKNLTSFSSKVRNDFFDNAHFLNYFGESELVLIIDTNENIYEFKKIINVTLRQTKAHIANDMLNYLNENIDDISQICFSKTRSGFKASEDNNHSNMVKIENLNNALNYLETHIDCFEKRKKTNLKSKLELQSQSPPIYDHNTSNWLLNNLQKLEVSKKQEYDIMINRKYYKIDLPRSNNYLCTNTKENHTIHWFILVSMNYCDELINFLKLQEREVISSFENSEYIRFDQVIKNSLNPILKRKRSLVEDAVKRLIRLKKIFDIIIPVEKLKPQFPLQTSFTLKNSHYAGAFNLFKSFYEANSVESSDDLDILMGIRNLSQIYEFCCLYQLINGISKNCFKQGGIISTRFISHDKTWDGKQTMKVNVLANQFVFQFDNERVVTLCYEKPFFTVDKNNPQNNTLIRITKSNRPYLPDFTIRVDNIKTGEHHYVILDAKFMTFKTVRKKYVEMYTKYGQELKAVKNSSIDSTAIKYLGLLYGISENKRFFEDTHLSSEHAPNGILPITPYFSTLYMGAKDNGSIQYLIDNYIL